MIGIFHPWARKCPLPQPISGIPPVKSWFFLSGNHNAEDFWRFVANTQQPPILWLRFTLRWHNRLPSSTFLRTVCRIDTFIIRILRVIKALQSPEAPPGIPQSSFLYPLPAAPAYGGPNSQENPSAPGSTRYIPRFTGLLAICCIYSRALDIMAT